MRRKHIMCNVAFQAVPLVSCLSVCMPHETYSKSLFRMSETIETIDVEKRYCKPKILQDSLPPIPSSTVFTHHL